MGYIGLCEIQFTLGRFRDLWDALKKRLKIFKHPP